MAKNKKQFRKLSEVRDRTLRKEAENEPNLLIQTTGLSHFINISYGYINPNGLKAHLRFLLQLPKAYRDYKLVHLKGNS